MPARTVGDQRWVQQGTNSAGDRVFVRNLSGASSAGYSDMTVAELQDLLESRGLAKSGNKAELVARLEEDDAS